MASPTAMSRRTEKSTNPEPTTLHTEDFKLRVSEPKLTYKSLKLTSVYFVTFLIKNVSCNPGDRA